MRPGRHLAIAWLVSSLVAGPGCAGSQAPWDVDELEQARFHETTEICRLLTDDKAGELDPEAFDRCMKRRGWKRQCFVKRIFSRN